MGDYQYILSDPEPHGQNAMAQRSVPTVESWKRCDADGDPATKRSSDSGDTDTHNTYFGDDTITRTAVVVVAAKQAEYDPSSPLFVVPKRLEEEEEEERKHKKLLELGGGQHGSGGASGAGAEVMEQDEPAEESSNLVAAKVGGTRWAIGTKLAVIRIGEQPREASSLVTVCLSICWVDIDTFGTSGS